jgi:hypothetical protein
LDHGVGDLRGVWADSLAAHDAAGGGIEDAGGLLTLDGLEGVGADTCCRSSISICNCL